MKNKILILSIVCFSLLLTFDNLASNEFQLKSKIIDFQNNGELISASGDVEIDVDNGIKIKSDKSFIDKKNSILEASENVLFIDNENNLEIISDKVIYKKNEDIIFFNGSVDVKFDDKYNLKSKNVVFNKKENLVFSKHISKLKDKANNELMFDSFKFNISNKNLSVQNLIITDADKNNYELSEAMLNMNYEEIIGKDVKIIFDKEIFGNIDNDPRLFGNSVIYNKNETIVNKGIFTSCKLRDDNKCPPWVMKAEQVKHNKNKKIIEYKNAWLNVYDYPIIYFPFFYHPDPTVKRQSGFLLPELSNSSSIGNALQIPYFKVISDNKDFTFSPKFFFDDKFLFQTEYRQKNKNSNFITDHSIKLGENSTNTHLFGELSSSSENNEYKLNFETTSNRNYLKKYDITSPLIENNTSLNSFVSMEKNFDESYLLTSFEIFEDLTKDDNDSYEYIYPNYIFNKEIRTNMPGQLEFNTSGYQKKYDTNKYDAVMVNDITYKSLQKINKRGFINNYSLILKNINTDGKNSSNHNNILENKILSSLQISSIHPMKKETKKNINFLTPKITFKYSPTETKNIKNEDYRVNYAELFNFKRFNDNQMIEGGDSFTLGLDYNSKNKIEDKSIGVSLGQVFRLKENNDLPLASSLGQKRSDFIGDLSYKYSDNLNLNYSFSIDNNLKETNYDFVETSLLLNKFETSFKFLNSNRALGDKSYISNVSKIKFDNNHSVNLSTNLNLDQNYTEYYDLIYEYKNDCFTAAVEYKKSFYNDIDIEANENILFSIKIIPFGKINTPSFN